MFKVGDRVRISDYANMSNTIRNWLADKVGTVTEVYPQGQDGVSMWDYAVVFPDTPRDSGLFGLDEPDLVAA